MYEGQAKSMDSTMIGVIAGIQDGKSKQRLVSALPSLHVYGTVGREVVLE